MNKKGSLFIEAVIILLLFALLISFVLDFAIVIWNKFVLNQITNSAIRTLSIQGGIGPQMLHQEYVTGSRLISRFNNELIQHGNFEEVRIYVNGHLLTNSTHTKIPYAGQVRIRVVARYSWRGITSYLGTNNLRNRVINVEKSAISFGR